MDKKIIYLGDISRQVDRYFNSIIEDLSEKSRVKSIRIIEKSFNKNKEKHRDMILEYISRARSLNIYSVGYRGVYDATLKLLLGKGEFATKETLDAENEKINENIQNAQELLKMGAKIRKLKHRFVLRTIGFEDYNENLRFNGILQFGNKQYFVSSLDELIEIVERRARERIIELNSLKATFKYVPYKELKRRYVDFEKQQIEELDKKIQKLEEEKTNLTNEQTKKRIELEILKLQDEINTMKLQKNMREIKMPEQTSQKAEQKAKKPKDQQEER